MERNPNVTVTVAGGKGCSGPEMITGIAGGTPPDVLESHVVAEVAARGAAIALDDFMSASNFDRTDVFDSIWLRNSWDGKTYGIPIQTDPVLSIAWNKKLFEEAGLDPETAPTTLEELRSFSDQITRYDDTGNIEVVGFRPTDGIGIFTSAWAAVGSTTFFNFDTKQYQVDTPEMHDVASYILSFYEAYGAENMAAFSANWGDWISADSAFGRGIQGMFIGAESMSGQLKEYAPDIDWGVSWMPTKAGDKLQMIGGHGNSIPTGVANPDAAWDFILFTYSHEAGDIFWNVAGIHPISRSYLEHMQKDFDLSDYTNLEWFITSMTEADRSEPLLEFLPVYGKVRDDFYAMIEEVAFGNKSLEEGLTEVQALANTATEETFRQFGG
jgi:multiple sugar transport system substrate-binding protein